MLKNNNIEDLFKESFNGYSVKPSENLWMKINKKLILKDFFRFNPGKFNAYYTALIIVAGFVTILSLNTSNNDLNDALIAENNNTTVVQAENHIETTDAVNETQANDESYINEIEINETENSNEDISNNNHNNNYIIVNNTEEESNSEGKDITGKLAKPNAKFHTSINEACEPAAIEFYNSSVNCDEFLWDFGNGETSSLKNPTFVFRSAGTYSVTLTVTSGSISSSMTSKITILPKPEANIFVDKRSKLYVNEEIQFTNESSDCGKNRWNFGDGNISTFAHPEHTYAQAGEFKVSLICYNTFNCTDTAFDDLVIFDEKYKIKAPNALTINNNGAANAYWRGNSDPNTVFHPFFNYDVSEYKLTIFSNTGSVVFTGNDPEYGWNGYFNNKPAPNQSTYVWICTGKFIDGTEFKENGSFNLFYTRN